MGVNKKESWISIVSKELKKIKNVWILDYYKEHCFFVKIVDPLASLHDFAHYQHYQVEIITENVLKIKNTKPKETFMWWLCLHQKKLLHGGSIQYSKKAPINRVHWQ